MKPNYKKFHMSKIVIHFVERRVLYDFEKYGDSPTCLNQEENIAGSEVFLQGSGLTEERDKAGPLVSFRNAKL